MSMSTGDTRRPFSPKETKATATDDDGAEGKNAAPAKAVGKAMPAKATPAKAAKATPSKTTGKLLERPATKGAGSGKGGGGRPNPGKVPAGKGGGGNRGRRPVTPVKVNQGPNWGPIMMFGGAGLVALLIVGFAAFQVIKQANQPSWQERAAGIEGLNNYLVSNPDWFQFPDGNHKPGVLTYPMDPPAGGVHNDRWQNCMGDVYPAEIAKEHAVHSLEHGAVWVTYDPNLAQDQVDELAGKVRDRQYVFMSPYPNLDKPISLQAWGYQLKVDNANDGRIDEFINALRQNATVEPGAICNGGITEANKTPFDLPAQ
jgi:hypothetical protein